MLQDGKPKISLMVLACAGVLALFLLLIPIGAQMKEEPGTVADKSSWHKATESASVGQIHLDVWTFFDMNTPDSYYIDLWKELGKAHGYEINIQTYSTQQIKDKLKIAAAEHSLPDIFLVWGGTYPDDLFDAGVCFPVQDYLKEADFLDSYTVPAEDGNNYIIPCLPEAYAVTYVNTDLAGKMDLEIPKSWDDVLELTQKVAAYNRLHGSDYAAIELGDRDSWLGELLYDQLVYRICPDAWDRLKAGEISFSDPAFAQAAKKVRQLTEAGAFPGDYLETGEVEAVENFINGEAVLFPHQSTILYYLLKNMGADSLSLIPFPDCSETPREDYETELMDINHTRRPGLCVCSYGGHPEEAARLCVEFSKQVNEINVTRYGYINMTKEEITPDRTLPRPVRQFRDLLARESRRTAYPYALYPLDQANDFRTLTKRFYAGEYDTDRFLKEGAKILDP